jgi:hypothetical protein
VGEVEIGFRLRQRRLGLAHLLVKLRRADDGENVALLHPRSNVGEPL